MDYPNVKRVIIALTQLAEDIKYFIDDIKQPNMNYQINEINFDLDANTTREHIQLLFDAIKEYNNNNNHCNIDLVTVEVTEDDSSTPLNTKLNGLHCPTKYFKLDVPSVENWTDLFTEITATLASGTNFNQFSFAAISLFGDEIPFEAEGFKEFCEYFVEHNDKLISLELAHILVTVPAMPHLVRLIQRSKALTKLKFGFYWDKDSRYDIFDALADSSVRILHMELYDYLCKPDLYSSIGKILANSPKLENLWLYINTDNIVDNIDFKNGLKMAQSLRKFELILKSPLNDLSMLRENESIVDCDLYRNTDKRQIKEITLRNRKLQNERVRSMIVLLYNIARSSHCAHSNESMPVLPRDIWALIVSHVKYPGVILDFGPIARSIFKDQSIRRVIGTI